MTGYAPVHAIPPCKEWDDPGAGALGRPAGDMVREALENQLRNRRYTFRGLPGIAKKNEFD